MMIFLGDGCSKPVSLFVNNNLRMLFQKILVIKGTVAYNAQIIVATIESMGNSDIDSFVEYAYDSMGFGYGEDHDGVLLLVCMDPREYRILSNGFAASAIESRKLL